MTSYFIINDWTKHNDVVYEAEKFLEEHSCQQVINYIDNKNSQCTKHIHQYHTPNNDPEADVFTWHPECFENAGESDAPGGYASFHGISLLVHQLNDAANRYTMQEMKLAKVVVHKYIQGSAGPEHTDVYPLATLMYLNDDYEGGNIYFTNSGLHLKPARGSMLAFDGGGVNKHGVTKIDRGTRYVFVAFWEYAHQESLIDFWNKESLSEDQRNDQINEKIRRKTQNYADAELLFPDKFPILKIHNFIDNNLASDIAEYLNINDIYGDECWGPPCFKEYYRVAYGEEKSPILIPGIQENTLSDLNAKIGEVVNEFMELEPGSLVFSKFKGHNHIAGSMSPPHTHSPAEAVAHLFLGDGFEGGMITVPRYNLEIKPQKNALYVFSEADDLTHGVSRVESGFRPSLVSHWQSRYHSYDKAGANV